MKHLVLSAVCFLFFGIPYIAFASSVVINEVMFDPIGSDTGEEWIELYNVGNQQVDISGWEIYPDGIGYITVPNGLLIGAKKFLLVHLRTAGSNSTTDIYQPSASSNMGNTSGSVALFSAGTMNRKDRIEGFVQWGKDGQTWESDANKKGFWEAGTYLDVNSFSEGNSIMLEQDGIASGGKNAWRISSASTPKAANSGASALSPVLPSPSASPLPFSNSSVGPLSLPLATPHTSPIKTIEAYAGKDISSMVGVMLEFLGHAKGINGEAIDSSARFFWNFGDGETQEGRSVSHIYRAPGTYVVGLHISSGEYAASDYIDVAVAPNLVSISGVVLGDDGYIRFANASDTEADISGWNIRDNQQRTFIFPNKSKLARRGDIAIMNSVTGLLKNPASLPLQIFYPNGIEALTFSDIIPVATLQYIKKEEVSALRTENSSTMEIKKMPADSQVKRPAISSPAPTLVPTSTPHQEDQENNETYAAVSHAPSASIPFVIALGVSILGAVGFLIAKQFS